MYLCIYLDWKWVSCWKILDGALELLLVTVGLTWLVSMTPIILCNVCVWSFHFFRQRISYYIVFCYSVFAASILISYPCFLRRSRRPTAFSSHSRMSQCHLIHRVWAASALGIKIRNKLFHFYYYSLSREKNQNFKKHFHWNNQNNLEKWDSSKIKNNLDKIMVRIHTERQNGNVDTYNARKHEFMSF